MNPTALTRNIARLQYAAVRLPFTVLDECVVASHWGEGASVRRGLELSLGSLDRFAGWLLADEQISRRGQALLRPTGRPARAGTLETNAPVRSARDERIVSAWPADARQVGGQDRETGGKIAADQDGDAPARHAGERAGDQPGRPAAPAARAGKLDVRFTLPAGVQAGIVALCGEFNNWSAHDIRLERGGDGSWQATVALERGRSYRYRYLLDGQRWENAWQADRYAPNPYGGTDSVVVVE